MLDLAMLALLGLGWVTAVGYVQLCGAVVRPVSQEPNQR